MVGCFWIGRDEGSFRWNMEWVVGKIIMTGEEGGGGRVRWKEGVEGHMGRVGGDGDGRGIRKWAQDRV